MRKRNGFTLIEMVLYMGIFSLFLIISSEIFLSTLSVQKEANATSNIEQDSRYILLRLMYDLRRAENIILPVDIGETQNELIVTISSIQNSFRLSGNSLVLTNEKGVNNLNSVDTEIRDLVFTRLGNVGGKNIIKISFKLRSRINNEEKNVETTLGVR